MKINFIKSLLIIILTLCVIRSTTENALSANGILEALNLRLIRKGIDENRPENFYHIAVRFKVFDKLSDGKLSEVYRGEYTSIMGMNALPQCMDYALFHMSKMERVKINCPARWAFRDNMVSTFKGVEKYKDYIIDMQLWNIGNVFKSVE